MLRIPAAVALVFLLLITPLTAYADGYAWSDSLCAMGGPWGDSYCWGGGGVPNGPDDTAFVYLEQPGAVVIQTSAFLGVALNSLVLTENVALNVQDNMFLNMYRSTTSTDPLIQIDNILTFSSPDLGTSRLNVSDAPGENPAVELTLTGSGEIRLGSNSGIQTGPTSWIRMTGGIEVYSSTSADKPATINGHLVNEGGEIAVLGGTMEIGGYVESSLGGFVEIIDQYETGLAELVVSGRLQGETVYPGPGTLRLSGGELSSIHVAAGDVEVVQNSTFTGQIHLAAATEVVVQATQALDALGSAEGEAPQWFNDGVIRLGSESTGGASLRAGGSIVELLGNGTVIMEGSGSQLTSLSGGYFRNGPDHTIEGQGNVHCNLQNQGLVVVDRGKLTFFDNLDAFGGDIVVLGDAITPATLDVRAPFRTHDFRVSPHGRVSVGNGWTIVVDGDWIIETQDPMALTWGVQTQLIFSGAGPGQAFEATSEDRGATSGGFSNNFAFPRIAIGPSGTSVFLRELEDNGNRNGSNGTHEAVYTNVLEVQPGTTLNLNGYCLYTLLAGSPYRVQGGDGPLFGGGTIVDFTSTAAPKPLAARRVDLLPPTPNPANPSTSIRFRLEERADVALQIFDLKGRRVKTFPTLSWARGDHSVTWAGRDDDGTVLASGVYTVRIEAGGDVAVRRVTLLK